MTTPTEPGKPRAYILAFLWAASVLAIAGAGWLVMIFVVPRLERDALEQRVRLPLAAEWLFAVSRWHVKYWYVEAVPVAFLCMGIATLILMFPTQGRVRTGCWVLWLLLIGIPSAALALLVAWQIAQVPYSFSVRSRSIDPES